MKQAEAFKKFVLESESRLFAGHKYFTVAKKLLMKIESTNKEWNINDLEDYVRQSRTKKEKKVETLLFFYQYCKEKLGIEIQSNLDKKIVIDDPLQRRIAIIKYMQNHKVTTSEIADVFMLDERTVRTDIRSLEDGIRIFDKDIKYNITHDKWKHCMEYSKHPVLLNLDMTEVIAMTIGLAELSKLDTLFAPQYEKIASEIYSSLTEYAKGKIVRMIKEKNLDFIHSEMNLYEKTISNSLINMWKSGCIGTIHVCHDDVEYVYTMCHVIDCYDNRIQIKTQQNKEVELLMEDIICCEYEMIREYC